MNGLVRRVKELILIILEQKYKNFLETEPTPDSLHDFYSIVQIFNSMSVT